MQPGFRINWLKMLPIALRAVLYSDCISKFYHASVVREKESGEAARLRDMYLEKAEKLILENRSKELFRCLSMAAADFVESVKMRLVLRLVLLARSF